MPRVANTSQIVAAFAPPKAMRSASMIALRRKISAAIPRADGYELFNVGLRAGIDHRSHLHAGLGGVPDDHLLRAADETLDHGVVGAVDHDQA